MVLIGGLDQPLDDLGIHVRAAMDHRSLAQSDVAFLFLLDRRAVGGMGHVDRHADLWVDAERAGLRPAQTELLLDGRDGVKATSDFLERFWHALRRASITTQQPALSSIAGETAKLFRST